MLLALDLSTTQTGYAVGAPGRRPRWGVFRPGNLTRDERVAYMAASVVQLCKAMGVTKVVAEQVSVVGKVQMLSAVALAECHGAVRYALRPLGLTMATLNLSSVRAQLGIREALGIKGAPKKPDVVRWVQAQGYPVTNGDEADALAIYLAVILGKVPTMDPTLKVRA